jgi:polynucleotide 5'-kinase involved in rRNA processing
MLNDMRAIEEAIQDELRHDQKPLTLFLLGGVDVGKTYTATALANRFYEHGLKVAVVDADVGQSDIGPPCCIGMGILERKIQKISEVPLHSLYFVGNTSPNGCMRECVNGAAAAAKKAKKLNVDVIIVDSTGWIEGEDAERFKLFEIKAIDTSFVIAIEKEDELGHIIQHLNENFEVIKLRMSSETRSRTREERRALREKAYTRYFRVAKNRVFELSILAWLPGEGTIVGLFDSKSEIDEKEIVGLGILKKRDYERGEAVIFTPVDTDTGDGATIRWIKPGVVKLIMVNGGFKEEAVYKKKIGELRLAS